MNVTAWIVVFSVFALGLFDIYAAVRWGYTGTISYDILTVSYSHPVIPLAAGILCGHLFWPQPTQK